MTVNIQDREACARLSRLIDKLPESKRSFALNLIEALVKFGSLSEGRRKWVNILIEQATAPADAPAAARTTIGDLSGIIALFDRAKAHLKRPAVELGVPGYDLDRAIRVSVATDLAKFPGSLTILSSERYDTGREFPERKWHGRITLDGSFQASRDLNCEPAYREAVVARLRAFAVDPSRVGAEDGLLHGRCCFCRKSLTDERSTAVGYGAKCAKNYGLVWGARPVEFAAEAVS